MEARPFSNFFTLHAGDRLQAVLSHVAGERMLRESVAEKKEPRAAWAYVKEKLAAQMYVRYMEHNNREEMPEASVQLWRKLANRKHILTYCVEEAYQLPCSQVENLNLADRRILESCLVPSAIGYVHVPMTDLEAMRLKLDALRLKNRERDAKEPPLPYLVFFCCLLNIYRQCSVLPEGGCRCADWQALQEGREPGGKRARSGAALTAAVRERIQRGAPSLDEHVARLMEPKALSRPVQYLCGLGFLLMDSKGLRYAPRHLVPPDEEGGYVAGGLWYEEPTLSLPLEILTCPNLPGGEEEEAAGEVQPTACPVYLFHWKDAPGVDRPEEDLLWYRRAGVNEQLVLNFLRVVCEMGRVEAGGEEGTLRAAEADGLLPKTEDPVAPEHRARSYDGCSHWLLQARAAVERQDPEPGEAVRQGERYCVWLLLYVFCHTEAGMAFFESALAAFWRARLQQEDSLALKRHTLELAEMGHLADSAGVPGLLEDLSDRVVQLALSRLRAVGQVASRCFLAQATLPAPLNTLLLRCRRLFTQWHPEVHL